jgi:hypothetical protein
VSTGDEDLLRSVTREVLSELLPGLLEDALTTPSANGNGNGAPPAGPNDDAVPQVPAPPIAKVHRPSGWHAPDPEPETAPAEVAFERVELRSDDDLAAFVGALARRLESPEERAAILSGQVRFRLAASTAKEAVGPSTIRVESGAVTERAVKEAARTGARLVLSPRAVLTPLARERARSLGVEIEKERRC